MIMEKGVAIIERTDTETRGIYIDQDTIEFVRLNAKISKHIAEVEKAEAKRMAKAEADRREADRNRRRAEKAEARRKAYNIHTIKHLLIDGGIIGAVTWAGLAGGAHPAICISVGLFFLCAGCLRLGQWLGRGAKK